MTDARARPRVGFIGAGRVGKGLSLALSRAGYEVVGLARRSGTPSAQEIVDRADLVFLTVPDDSLIAVVESLSWKPDMAAVHCSGAAELSVLSAAARAGAAVGGFHPLQMFADPEVAAKGLAGCAIAVEADEPLASALIAMAEALKARPLRVPAGARAAYHAGAHYAGPFIAALLAEAVGIWSRIGIAPEDALAALLPLARGATDALLHSGLRAMAGSVARGDVRTLERHIEALSALDPDLRDLYCRLALRTIPLASALTPARADEIRACLSQGLSSAPPG